MKRIDPPSRSGPSAEESRVAGQRPNTRSDAGRASPTSHSSPSLSKPTAPVDFLASTGLTIVLRGRGRSRFAVGFGEKQIVKSSAQPICDAARVLHRLGYADDCRITVWHEGADHHAISGLLGFWRKQRIREDRGMPRYASWEARPRRVGAKKGRGKFNGVQPGAKKKNAPPTTPGAAKEQSTMIPRRRARRLEDQL
jgi:hypothetical protein